MQKTIGKYIFDLESTGLLDNLFERILCICVYNVDTKETKCFTGKDEQLILIDFFNDLKLYDDITLIGFNSESFDLPFIIRRAVVHGLYIPTFRSKDLRKIVNGFNFSYNRNEKGKLRDWATVLGIPITTENGSEMFELYKKEEFGKIRDHCIEDLKVTNALYERVDKCGLL